MSKSKEVIFKKQYLLECLKFTEEEAVEIIEYQKLLPILQKDNSEWGSSRDLHKQLKVNRKFTDWIKQQLEDIDAEKEKDFCFLLKGSKTTGSGGHNKKECFITISIAKEIAMVAGVKGGNTNPELKAMSKMVRKYFILIEEAIKRDVKWQSTRFPQKPVTLRIRNLLFSKYIKTFKVKPKNIYFLTANMDMVNLLAFGFTAKEINDYLERPNDGKTREHLKSECLERLTYLLEQHEILLKRGFDFNTRECELVEMYTAKYGNELNPFNGEIYPISYNRPTWWDMTNVI